MRVFLREENLAQGDRPNTPLGGDYDMFSRDNMAPAPVQQQQRAVRAILRFYLVVSMLPSAGRSASRQLASVDAAAHNAVVYNAAATVTAD